MRIEVTFKNIEEKYVANTSSSLVASMLNLMPGNFDIMTEEEKKTSSVQLEIKDYEGQFVPIEDKAVLYKLYQLANTRPDDIKDISIYSSTTGNLIYSTEVFGYNISSAGLGDFYMDSAVLENEALNQNGNYPHIFVSIRLVLKEE